MAVADEGAREPVERLTLVMLERADPPTVERAGRWWVFHHGEHNLRDGVWFVSSENQKTAYNLFPH
jgi:hypothetical protein